MTWRLEQWTEGKELPSSSVAAQCGGGGINKHHPVPYSRNDCISCHAPLRYGLHSHSQSSLPRGHVQKFADREDQARGEWQGHSKEGHSLDQQCLVRGLQGHNLQLLEKRRPSRGSWWRARKRKAVLPSRFWPWVLEGVDWCWCWNLNAWALRRGSSLGVREIRVQEISEEHDNEEEWIPSNKESSQRWKLVYSWGCWFIPWTGRTVPHVRVCVCLQLVPAISRLVFRHFHGGGWFSLRFRWRLISGPNIRVCGMGVCMSVRGCLEREVRVEREALVILAADFCQRHRQTHGI